VRVGQVGFVLKCDCEADITGATNIKMSYTKPDGTSGQWDAVIDDTARMVQYSTKEGDIDQKGRWKFEPVLTLDGFTGAADKSGSLIAYATLV